MTARRTWLAALGALACASAGTGGATGAAGPVARGAPGDTVRVIVNHVLADRRGQFERFLHESLAPAMRQVAPSDPTTDQQMRRARLLRPTAMDRDSTYAYVFIVDPVVSSASYSFTTVLTKAYGAERAAEQMKQFRESLARPQETYLVVNERW